MSDITIRIATVEDAEDILRIYNPYILNSVITFEYEEVSVEEFQGRISNVLSAYPWLVCLIDNKIVGYAYCSPHRVRAAYDWDCECTVYLDPGYHRRRIGHALYEALFHLVKLQGYYNVYSLICVPNEGSVALHKKHSFKEIGYYSNTAYKFGEWRHLSIMEKRLQDKFDKPAQVMKINELDKHNIDEITKAASLMIK